MGVNGIANKKNVVKISAVILIIVIGAGLIWRIYSAYAKPQPEKVIKSFETAFNRYDLDGMLKCIQPSYAETLKGAAAAVTGKWNLRLVGKLAQMGVPLLPFISDSALGDALPKIKLTVTAVDIEGAYATCDVSGVITVVKHSFDFTQAVRLVLIGGNWYIDKVN